MVILFLIEIISSTTKDRDGNHPLWSKKSILIEDEEFGDASMIGMISILTLFLILGNLEAVSVVNHHPDDEYVLEHEVLYKDALAEAKKLETYLGKNYFSSIILLAS